MPKKKRYAFVESMTTVKLYSHVVRVWREEKEVKTEYENTDIMRFILELAVVPAITGKAIAERVIAMPRVTAVEVINHLGNGTVIYKEWP